MGSIELCCVVPHAPILVPEVGRKEICRVPQTEGALRELAEEIARLAPETLVVVSPPHLKLLSAHGFAVKASKSVYGSLSRFGAPSSVVHARCDNELIELLEEFAPGERVDLVRDSSDREDDWGLIVPLCLIAPQEYRLVSITASPYLSLNNHCALGRVIKKAVLRSERRTVFVASGDMSHRLTRDAPSGYSPRGTEFDHMVVDIVSRGGFAEIFDIDPELRDEAGEDCLYSLSVLAGIIEGCMVESAVLSYEGTFGVGYMVARVRPA